MISLQSRRIDGYSLSGSDVQIDVLIAVKLYPQLICAAWNLDGVLAVIDHRVFLVGFWGTDGTLLSHARRQCDCVAATVQRTDLKANRIQDQQIIIGDGLAPSCIKSRIHNADKLTGDPVIFPMAGLLAIAASMVSSSSR